MSRSLGWVSVRHYVLSCLVALVTVLVRWRLVPWLGDGIPTVSLLGAVAFAVWYGGTGPAVIAACVGYGANTYLFPFADGPLHVSDPRLLANTFVFVLSAGLIMIFAAHLRRVSERARLSEARFPEHEERWQTERAQLLESERTARATAEQANRMKDEFLAVVSHELRTPLSNVISWSRLLQSTHAAGEPHLQRGLGIIVNNATAQGQLIADLLDMSRIVAGKVVLEPEPLDLSAVVDSAVHSHRPALEEKGLWLTFERPPEPAIVLGDAARMQQVMWNLLSNAIKFTPGGGQILLVIRRAGHLWELSVRDTGEGIAAEFIPHLFDRFRQADGSISRRYGGLGIGLAIVHHLVELHGGTIHAQSDGPGHGATFSVQLPVYSGEMRGHAHIGPQEVGFDEPENKSLADLSILAVEDHPDMLDYIKQVLEEHGAVVRTASSAGEALQHLEEAPDRFQVLVSDIGMSGLDGYGLIGAIRGKMGLGSDRLKAIAVSAFARDEDRLRALGAGFQAYLSKPYQVAQLVRTVKQVSGREQTSSRLMGDPSGSDARPMT